jgi:hypothetical protein
MRVALILALRFQRWFAWALLALFVIQFPFTSTTERLLLCGAYAVIALGAMVVDRGRLLSALTALFTRRDLRRHSALSLLPTAATLSTEFRDNGVSYQVLAALQLPRAD